MRCPHCGFSDSRVTNSRVVNAGIRRRRECADCHRRYTTYERIHASVMMVTKRDRRREAFDREKLVNSILKACAKRPVSVGSVEKIADDIEGDLQEQGEAATSAIGAAVMEHLKQLDRVAYIRFASVYRDFQDIESFEQAVNDLRDGDGGRLTGPPSEPGRSARQGARGAAAANRSARRRRSPEADRKTAAQEEAARTEAARNAPLKGDEEPDP